MEEKIKNNKYLKIIIVAIVVIIFIVIGLLLFNVKPGSSNNSYSNTKIIEKLPEWAKYLLNLNISSITYESVKEDDICDTRNISIDQLTRVLSIMTESRLMKYNYGNPVAGCNHRIIIKYDDKEFTIDEGFIISVQNNDSKIISLLDKEDFTYIKPETSDPWMVFEYGWDTSYLDSLFK